MDKPSNSVMLFPGEESWELWQSTAFLGAVAGELSFRNAPGPRVLALPASCTYAIPHWLIAQNDEEMRNSAQLHLEKEGLLRPEDPAGFDYERLEQKEARHLIRIDALASCDLRFLAGSPSPSAICLSPWALPVPDERIVIWRELGRFVVAFKTNGKIVYYNILTASRIDAKAVDEILRWSRQFAFQAAPKPFRAITVWTSLADLPVIERQSGLPVETGARPIPRHVATATTVLVPPVVRELRQHEIRRTNLRRVIFAGLAAAGLLVAGTLTVAGMALHRKKELTNAIADLAPAALEIQQIQRRWSEVAPAVEPASSPLETLLVIRGVAQQFSNAIDPV